MKDRNHRSRCKELQKSKQKERTPTLLQTSGASAFQQSPATIEICGFYVELDFNT